MKVQLEKEFRHMSMVVCTSIGTVTKVSIKFVEREERKQKGSYEYTKQNTQRAQHR